MEMHSKRAMVKENIKRQSVMEDNGIDNTEKLPDEPNKDGALYVYNLISKVGRTLSLSVHCGGHSKWEKEWQTLRGLRIEDGGPVCKYAHDVVLIQTGDYVIHKRRGMCSILFGYKPEARDGRILDTAVVVWPLQRTAD
ncbi:hypothetical protein POM88_040527 [Heracleum sosnowskyi]|uniref:Uncharacterized protein n=1 Tax=Heracleum sosnowskyi TaxID=360622 RepID=A0AAD8M8W7_9APIA|nr:hypothetical protein POM88_040527 [Heracleum sosnowskyi]